MTPSILLFIRAHRRPLLELLAASFLVNTCALALPVATMLVVDRVVGNDMHDTLWAIAAGLGLLVLLEFAMRSSRVMLAEDAAARWDAQQDERLITKVLVAPLSRPLPVGEVMSRYRDLGAARDGLPAQCLLPISDLPFVLMSAVALWVIGGPLVLVALSVSALMMVAAGLLLSASRERQHRAEAAHGSKLTALVEVLLARESLTGAGASRRAAESFLLPSAQVARAGAHARLWSQLVLQLRPLWMSITALLILVVGVYRVEAQALTVGGWMACGMLATRLLSSLAALAPVALRAGEFLRAMARMNDTVGGDPDTTQPDPTVQPPQALRPGALAVEGLVMEGVDFAYPSAGRRSLEGIDLQFKLGEMVVLVGTSGAGKSTLLRVLAGRLAPTAGRMGFGGQGIDSDERRHWLARQVAYQAQEAAFLAGTVAQVVAPDGCPPDDTALLAALHGAGLGPALSRGDLELNTDVGTNGCRLSGGQRQMLSLARALYAKHEVMLFDEPTLGLDHTAQRELLRSLDKLRQGRCLVVATHTTELIQLADRVLIIDRGQVVVDSPPARLFKGRKGLAAGARPGDHQRQPATSA